MASVFRESAAGWPIKIDFYIGHKFTIVPFITVLDPLRIANDSSGRTLFEWHLISDDGRPVTAINGMTFPVDSAIDDVVSSDNLFMFIGFDPIMELPQPLANWLRRLVATGTHLGAAGAGALFLAQDGLLDGYSATIHWNYRDSFAETFPNIRLSRNTFEFDRNRFTCAGGTATMTMMLHAIAVHFGNDLASEVADMFIAGEPPTCENHFPYLKRARIGVARSAVNTIIDEMETHVEFPLTIAELAKRAGLSQRQLGRVFRQCFNMTPVRYYNRLRLQYGRRLMQQTDLQATEVAYASGFRSPEHFFRTYRAEFDHTPLDDRRESRRSIKSLSN